MKKPTTLSKNADAKGATFSIDRTDASPDIKPLLLKNGTRDNSDVVLSIEKFEGGR